MSVGKFITVEGQDGAGKSTNIDIVADYLTHANIDFIHTREPGGTPFGECVRKLLLGSSDHDFGNMAELLLMFAARAQHLEEVIMPALTAGKWVLCDRFTDASFAYQGGGRGVDLDTIKQLQQIVHKDLTPNLTLLLDLPVEIGQQRASQRSSADRFERQKLEFKARVRDTYLTLAEQQPERIRLVDASETLEQVAESIRRHLDEFVHG